MRPPSPLSLSLIFGPSLFACTAGPSGGDTDGQSDANATECELNPEDPAYVQIGFWMNSDCSGEPIKINSFPVEADAPCYCWPGNSGENSAIDFSCDPDAQSFTYTQYTTLTCGGGNGGVVKTSYTDKCEQDIPPTLYSKIVDYGACTP